MTEVIMFHFRTNIGKSNVVRVTAKPKPQPKPPIRRLDLPISALFALIIAVVQVGVAFATPLCGPSIQVLAKDPTRFWVQVRVTTGPIPQGGSARIWWDDGYPGEHLSEGTHTLENVYQQGGRKNLRIEVKDAQGNTTCTCFDHVDFPWPTPSITPTVNPPTVTPTNTPPSITPTVNPPTVTPTNTPPSITPTEIPEDKTPDSADGEFFKFSVETTTECPALCEPPCNVQCCFVQGLQWLKDNVKPFWFELFGLLLAAVLAAFVLLVLAFALWVFSKAFVTLWVAIKDTLRAVALVILAFVGYVLSVILLTWLTIVVSLFIASVGIVAVAAFFVYLGAELLYLMRRRR